MTSERDELQAEPTSTPEQRTPHEVSWDGKKLSLTHGTSVTFLYPPFSRVEERAPVEEGRRRFEVHTDDGQKASVLVAESDQPSLDALLRASRNRSAAPRAAASSSHLTRAGRWAAIVEAMAWVYFAAGLAASIAVAERHGRHSPYVWQGIAVALTTTLLSLAAVMAAAYIRGRTE